MATTGDDCYFFYYSSCTKGPSCPYRHVEAARGNEVTCINWKQGYCYRPNCAFRHMEITKNRSEIACYWESQPSGCQKPHCPFKHVNKPNADSGPTASTSLINRIPTIVGPVTKPPPPAVTQANSAQPLVASSVHTLPVKSLDDLPTLPTVKPVVVQPLDSEDDESLGTMSADGSPGKRMLLSPVRPVLGQENLSARPKTTIRPTFKARATVSQEKPRSFGIKTLAEIRREKNIERGHEEERDKEEEVGQMKEEEEEEGEEEKEGDDDEEMFPSLSRRIISVSDSGARKINPVENRVKPLSQKVIKVSQPTEKPGVKSLAQLRENRFKRLGSSLDTEELEKEKISKRLKVMRKDPETENLRDGAPKKTLVRRVMIGGEGKKTNKDSEPLDLDAVKVKTVTEIKMDRLKARLGNRLGDVDPAEDKVSTAQQRRRLTDRLGQIRTADNEEGAKGVVTNSSVEKKPSVDRRFGKAVVQESSFSKKSTLAARIGKVFSAIEDDAAGDSSLDPPVRKRMAARLGKVPMDRGDGDNPKDGIKIKSLEDIMKDRLLKRLGKPLLDTEGEDGNLNKKKGSSSQEQEEEGDERSEEEEEEESDEEEEEEKQEKPLGDIRIKTLAEIRQEKQSRQPVSSQSTTNSDTEGARDAQKKGAQSAAERRTKRRVEMALYKPPGAARGLKENQGQGPRTGIRRIPDASQDAEKADDKPAIKVRRLNLTRSVENANKGTDSLLSVIKQKKDAPKDDAPAIKIKSLAEIRAEKQRLAQKTDASGGESGASGDEERTAEEEQEGKKRKTDEERRRERRAKIWSRSPVKTNTEEPVKEKPSAAKGGVGEKSLDEIRRERRARLWNTTGTADDGLSKTTVRRPGGQVIAGADSPSQIKIKTLAEIRREKQRLMEQQESSADPLSQGTQESTERILVTEQETGSLSSSVSTTVVDRTTESRRELPPVSQAPSVSSSNQVTKLTRKPLQGRRGRRTATKSQVNLESTIQSTPTSTSTDVQSAHPAPHPKSLSSVPTSLRVPTTTQPAPTVEPAKPSRLTQPAPPMEPEPSRPTQAAATVEPEPTRPTQPAPLVAPEPSQLVHVESSVG